MKRIWAVGASVRALTQSLLASGHEVLAADLFNDFDLQRIAPTQRIVDFPHDLLRLVESVEADGFIYTGGLENYPELIDALAEKLPLLGNPGHVLRRVRDVPTLRATLEGGRFQMPPMAEAVPLDTAQRWLKKSADSSGGLRMDWARPEGGPLKPGEYYQTFIEGPVYGASFLAADGDVRLLGLAQQLTACPWTNAPAFHYAGSIGPLHLSDELHQEIERLGRWLTSEFQLRGWFGIDVVVDQQQRLWVLEINPRYTASMEVLQPGNGMLGKAIVYTKQRIHVSHELTQYLVRRGDAADIPCPGSELLAGGPVVSVFAQGASAAAVRHSLQDKAVQLQTKLRAHEVQGVVP